MSGVLLAVGAVLLWSTNALIAGFALRSMTVPQILVLGFASAAVVFLYFP
jgi:hypothetical protein